MNFTKNSINGLVLDIIGQLLIQILILFITPKYISLSSKELFGLWLLVNSIIGWISIADSGISIALSRSLILYKNKSDSNYNSILITNAFFFFLITAFIFLILGISVFNFGLSFFNLSQSLEKPFTHLLILSLIASIASLFFSIFSSILESNFHQSFIRLNNSISTIIGTLFGFILMINNVGIISIAIGVLTSVLINGFINLFKSKIILEYKIRYLFFDKKVILDLFKFGGYFQIGKIGNIIALNADNIVITILFGPIALVSYNFTFKLSQLFGNIIASKIPISILSAFTHHLVFGETEKLKNIVNKLIRILVRASLLFGLFILFLNKLFVTWWVGPSNFSGWSLTFIFAAWTIYETLYRGSNAIIYAHGNLKKWSFFSLIEGFLNLLLSYVLGKSLGIMGIAIATIVSRITTSGFYTVYFFMMQGYIDNKIFKNIIISILKTFPTLLILIILYLYIPDTYLLLKIFIMFLSSIFINIITFDFKILYKNRNNKFNELLINLINSQ